MKKLLLASSAAAMAVLGLIACGDETTINQITQDGIQKLAAGESLGKCSDKNAGEMFFVTDSSAVYYCADGKWKSLNGKDGSDGDKGEDGTSSTDTLVTRDTVAKLDTVVKKESVVLDTKDTVFLYDTLFTKDTIRVYDTTVVEYEPEYDTVTTAYLNQEMLAEGKYGTMVDSRDNKVYRTIVIGEQTWMAQNLAFEADGIMSYCLYNSVDSCAKYGRLYRWSQAMNLSEYYTEHSALTAKGADSILFRPARGICPQGWHIPDTTEMKTLEDYVKAYNTVYYPTETVAASMMSREESAGWNEGKAGKGSDMYGFSAMPAGWVMKGEYNTRSTDVFFWMANEGNATSAMNRAVLSGQELFGRNTCSKQYMLSVRCLKNAD